MIYIINECIGYRPEDGVLFRNDSDDAITLQLPAQRLLLVILESGGQILARDDLMEQVWDRYGLTGSGSNLNQYLSILRRSIAAFGCEEFIETLPKVGIRLYSHVRIEKEAGMILSVSSHSDALEIASPAEAPAPPGIKAGLSRFSFWLLTGGVFILSALTASLLTPDNQFDPRPVYQAMDGGCRLVTFEDPAPEELEHIRTKVSSVVRNFEKKCTSSVTVYFDNASAQSLQGDGRTMLSLCSQDKSGDNIVCNNSYFLRGGMNEK